MQGVYFLVPTLLAVLISFLFVRGAGIALMMTGLEKKKARFQALSAFSGTGFTTKEAELVVNHPVRRRIIIWLMIMGNAGIVVVIVTAASSLVTSRGFLLPINFLILLIGIYLIYKLATRRGFLKRWEGFIEKKLVRSSVFEEATTEDLLHFQKGFGLVKKIISEKSMLKDCTLLECGLSKKGLLVLGIERGNAFPAPYLVWWLPLPSQ